MNKNEFLKFITDYSGALPEYPFNDDTVVFRHSHNRKWFTIVMRIPRSRLGLYGTVDTDKIKWLAEMSFELTAGKPK